MSYTPEQYDNFYTNSLVHKMKYHEFDFFRVWFAAAHWVKDLSVRTVIDLGCGPGHFASTLLSLGWDGQFTGEDFSPIAIRMARQREPRATFVLQDICKRAPITADAVTAFEVFEHIDDLALLFSRIRPRTPICFSVPNHEGFGHIRSFIRQSEVAEFFNPWINITSFRHYQFRPKETFWLVTGERRNNA